MKILSKISAVLIILTFSLCFGQEAKDDTVKIDKEKNSTTDRKVNQNYRKPRSGKNRNFETALSHPVMPKGLKLYDKNKISYSFFFNNKARFKIDGKTFEIREGDSLAIGIITEEAIIDSSKASDNFKIGSEYKGKVISVNERSVYVDTFIDGILVKFSINSNSKYYYKTRKPIIYIYPEKESEVNVKLDYKGTFTATYPKYPENGWTVTAKPDGTLKDKSGKEYYSLFWEGETDKVFTIDEGFVMKRENSVEFLEKSLKTLGLNYKEANEFIIFWLPELEKNPYNLIHFSTKEYEELAKLTITPEPETIIRVFMVFQGLDKPVEIKEQKLVPKDRKGYTVVEWGGTEIKSGSRTAVK